jgi:hypothetical protein
MSWADTILSPRPPEEIWTQVFAELLRLARTTASPVELHQTLVPADRLLAESAGHQRRGFPRVGPHIRAECLGLLGRADLLTLGQALPVAHVDAERTPDGLWDLIET